MRPEAAGVTLLELLLIVALVALLGALGIPAYRNVVERVQVHAAMADIGTLSVQLYRWETNAGRFPRTLAEAGLDGLVDPWDRPYVYLNVQTAKPGDVRRDKNLVPINTDFDLYSTGRDGATATALTAQSSRDDVVRANNGGYIGLAKDY